MKINSRQIEKAMKQMGMRTEEIPAEEVIIRCPEKEIIIKGPQVTKVNMMGQETFQITGSVEEREQNSDIKMIIEQTGATEGEAQKALEESDGDIAAAILKLK